MARIEKTVFISYRRSDVYTALAVYETLKNQGYDVFFDYRSISSGDFEQIITSNIRARAHFLLILTPTALDRCNEPADWLRREIEFAMAEKRNIVPMFFRGFRFGDPSVVAKLTGKLKNLSRYNGLNIHEDYFDEGMQRLCTQYLNIPLDTVLHPLSNTVQKAVREEQVAADKALEQIPDVKGLVGQTGDEVASRSLEKTPASIATRIKQQTQNGAISYRVFAGIAGVLVLVALALWGMPGLRGQSPVTTLTPTQTLTPSLTPTITPSPTETLIPPTPTLGFGSAVISGKDGMTLVYVPAGKFTMGSTDGDSDETPVHTVYLNAFWIDQTEVTNLMYSECVTDGKCVEPSAKGSNLRESYYGNPQFANYPVIFVSWSMADTYCSWAGRRLPTEAEWEKAARGDDGRIYPWGNDSPDNDLLNYGVLVGDTTEVGVYPSGVSPYGALDMAGNVTEWVADWYDANYYNKTRSSNPLGPISGQGHIDRGGAFDASSSGARVSNRDYWSSVDYSSPYIGFRCVVSDKLLIDITSVPQPLDVAPPLTVTSTFTPTP